MWSRKVFLLLCTSAIGLFVVALFRLKPIKAPEFLYPNAKRFRLSRVCGTDGLLLINSASENVHRRQVIRETWGHPKITDDLGIKVAFGIGAAPDGISQASLDWESEVYGDVFQVPFTDVYRDLPRKIVHLLKLSSEACPSTPFIAKVDDDVFVNIFAFQNFISENLHRAFEKTIFCLLWQEMLVIRSNNSKWSVTEEQFKESVYPPYCSGAAYVITKESLKHIVELHFEKLKDEDIPISLEDVYITGLLAKELGIKHEQLGPRYAFKSINDQDLASGKTIFAHLGKERFHFTLKFWEMIKIRANSNVYTKKEFSRVATYDINSL